MSKILFFISLAIFTAFSSIVSAAQMPRYLGTEKKFRSYIYNPNDVYRYIGHYTYQGFIEFEEDETVATISMGDPTLWLFEHLGNRLFLKPVGEDNSETNMTIITNKKVYHFELMAKEANGITDKDLIFVAKFAYPDEKDKNIVSFPKIPPSDKPDMRDLTIYNFDYQYTGEPSIAPIRVFDNAEFTYFQFTKKNAEIPAIFTVDAAGFESLVNFRSAGSYIIVERVSPQFTLRNGNDIVCVYNTGLYINGNSRALGSKSISTNRRVSVAPSPIIPQNPTMQLSPALSQASGVMPQSSSRSRVPSIGNGGPSNVGSYMNSSTSSPTFGTGSNPETPPGYPVGMPSPGALGADPSSIRMPGQPY